jgi:hypothetical protein
MLERQQKQTNYRQYKKTTQCNKIGVKPHNATTRERERERETERETEREREREREKE